MLPVNENYLEIIEEKLTGSDFIIFDVVRESLLFRLPPSLSSQTEYNLCRPITAAFVGQYFQLHNKYDLLRVGKPTVVMETVVVMAAGDSFYQWTTCAKCCMVHDIMVHVAHPCECEKVLHRDNEVMNYK